MFWIVFVDVITQSSSRSNLFSLEPKARCTSHSIWTFSSKLNTLLINYKKERETLSSYNRNLTLNYSRVKLFRLRVQIQSCLSWAALCGCGFYCMRWLVEQEVSNSRSKSSACSWVQAALLPLPVLCHRFSLRDFSLGSSSSCLTSYKSCPSTILDTGAVRPGPLQCIVG